MGLRLEHDPEANAVYITLRRRRVAYTEPVAGAVDHRLVDYAADGTPVGIDLMDVSKGVDVTGLPEADAVAAALERAGLPVRPAAAAG